MAGLSKVISFLGTLQIEFWILALESNAVRTLYLLLLCHSSCLTLFFGAVAREYVRVVFFGVSQTC